jgi:hypothetical protein
VGRVVEGGVKNNLGLSLGHQVTSSRHYPYLPYWGVCSVCDPVPTTAPTSHRPETLQPTTTTCTEKMLFLSIMELN